MVASADPMSFTGNYNSGKVLNIHGALYIRQVRTSISTADYLGQGVYDSTTYINAGGANNNFIWQINGGQKMYLSNAGYFGVGVNPTSDFHLQGTQFRHNDATGWHDYSFTISPGVVRLASTASFVIQTADVSVTSTSSSTSTTTGALQVVGGVGIGGDLYFGGIISGGGVRTSTTTTTPTPASVGDVWYYQGTDAVYRYQYDGTTSTWVDVTGPNLIGLYQYQGNAASTPAYLSAASGNNFITPSVAWAAAAPVTLTDAATITVDLSAGINFTCLLTSGVGTTRRLDNFVNPKPGQTGWIMFTQSATGNNNVTFGTNWHWPLGTTGTFSTSTVNAVDILFYTVLTPTYYLGNMANRVV